MGDSQSESESGSGDSRSHSDADDEELENESDQLIKEREAFKGKKDLNQAKAAPKPYTGFDDMSEQNRKKIEGDLAQRYFLERAEDIEGFGHETQLQQLKEHAEKQ